jgi:tRNA (cytidine/uridine-2'-O-)-methyltransferase
MGSVCGMASIWCRTARLTRCSGTRLPIPPILVYNLTAMIRLALFQPDIAQNTGTLVRLAACLGVATDIIEPCGFDASDRNFRRAGMDYIERAAITRHDSFTAFVGAQRAHNRRLILGETDGTVAYTDFAFRPGDVIIVGRESAGSTPEVYASADASVVIPMVAGLRSINVALAATLLLGEALRQTAGFPTQVTTTSER